MLITLPIELQIQILSCCDVSSLLELSQTCKQIHDIVFQDEIWFSLVFKELDEKHKLKKTDHWMETQKRKFIASGQNWYVKFKLLKELLKSWGQGKTPPPFIIDGHSDSVYCCQSDHRKLVTGSRDKSIKIWDWDTLNHVVLKGHTASVLCLQYDDEILVSGSSDTNILIWSMQDYTILHKLMGHAAPVLDIKLDKKRIASCSKDNTIKIWDRNTREQIHMLTGHSAAVNAICLHQDTLVSASGDATIKLWDLNSAKVIKEFIGHTRGLACIQYNGEIIVSGSNDKTIKIWNVETGHCMQTLTGHTDLVRTLALSHRYVASGSYDFSIKLWDIQTGKLVLDIPRSHNSWVFHVMIEYDRIVSTSQDHTVNEWRFMDKEKSKLLEPVFEIFKF